MKKRKEPERKDWLDKFDVFGRFGGTVITALATVGVAVIGIHVNNTLIKNGNEASARDQDAHKAEAERERREHLFEFGTTHQLAMAQMRWQAFDTFAKQLPPTLTGDNRTVALMAGLQSCASDIVDTRPILEALSTSVNADGAKVQLKKLAMLVARSQEQAILRSGGYRGEINLTGVGLKDEVHGHIYLCEQGPDPHELKYWLTIPIRPTNSLKDRVHLKMWVDDNKPLQHPFVFDVNYTDFPLLDNVTVRHEDGGLHHIAVILTSLKPGERGYDVSLEFLHFPENYVSGNDALETLRQTSDTAHTDTAHAPEHH